MNKNEIAVANRFLYGEDYLNEAEAKDIVVTLPLGSKYKYNVEIIDGTHLKMKEVGTDRWGTALHFGQVQSCVIKQLTDLGLVKGNFFKENIIENTYYVTWDKKDEKNVHKFMDDITEFTLESPHGNTVQGQIEVRVNMAKDEIKILKDIAKKYGGIVRGDSGKRIPENEEE